MAQTALRLQPGDDVDVRNRFDGSWSSGFQVDDAAPHGYRLRRRSDGTLLPALFDTDDLRPSAPSLQPNGATVVAIAWARRRR